MNPKYLAIWTPDVSSVYPIISFCSYTQSSLNYILSRSWTVDDLCRITLGALRRNVQFPSGSQLSTLIMQKCSMYCDLKNSLNSWIFLSPKWQNCNTWIYCDWLTESHDFVKWKENKLGLKHDLRTKTWKLWWPYKFRQHSVQFIFSHYPLLFAE